MTSYKILLVFIFIIYIYTVNPPISVHPLLSARSNKRPLEKKKFNKRLPLVSAPSNKRRPTQGGHWLESRCKWEEIAFIKVK